MLVCLLGLIAYAEETQEQQVQRLIGELQGDDFNVRSYATYILGKIGLGAKDKDAVLALIQALQEPAVSYSAAEALGKIGTPEALEAVKEYEKSNW